jgi:ribosomal protein S18 acetylase RimI-like enzyme
LVVHRLDTHIFLEYIAILPEFQNRGIGTELIREVLEEAAAKGFPVELKVLKINPAIRLYERLGFEVESRTETRFFMAAEPIERST